MTLWGLKTCDTCRKAMRALESAGLAVELADVRAVPPGAARLAEWYAAFGAALVNTRSTTWRGLDEATRARAGTAEGAVAVLEAYPALMKRPVIEAGGAVHLGWSKTVEAALTVR